VTITMKWWMARTIGVLFAGLCAFAGAVLSTDQTLTGAIWSASAFVLLAMSVHGWNRVRILRQALKQQLDDDARSIAIGRRAHLVFFSVIEREGALYADSLAELIEKTPDAETTQLVYDEPWRVTLYFTDTTRVGATDGRPE
jgi:hypothetical protein